MALEPFAHRSLGLGVLAALAVGCGGSDELVDGGESSGVRIRASSRVFAGSAAMLYDGPACTAEAGALSDRWCGFVGLSAAGARSLFVVNVSQVVAGVAVDCGGSDPNCLMLTSSLGGDSFNPTWHGTAFQGDTLVYYDDTFSPYAWRPGMQSGRLLVSVSAELDAAFCTPAPRGSAVACLGIPSAQPDASLTRAELLAGKVDGPNTPLLTAIDNVIVANSADGIPRFGFGFPAVEGGYVAWSTREVADGPEVLKLQKVDDAASKLTVASDVHGWNVSHDGARWVWLRGIALDGAGLLQTAGFPGGERPTDVLPNVATYGLPPSGGSVVARTAAGALSEIADPVGAPSKQLILDTGVQALLSFSDEGHLAYAKHFVGTNQVDLFIASIDGAAPCVADTTTSVPISSLHFSPNARAAIWARAKVGGFDAFHTRLSDCSTVSLAADVMALGWIEGAVIFMDTFDADKGTGSMRFHTIGGSHAPDERAPTLVAEQVDTYAIAGPPPGALLYSVSGDGDADGIYVTSFAPLCSAR